MEKASGEARCDHKNDTNMTIPLTDPFMVSKTGKPSYKYSVGSEHIYRIHTIWYFMRAKYFGITLKHFAFIFICITNILMLSISFAQTNADANINYMSITNANGITNQLARFEAPPFRVGSIQAIHQFFESRHVSTAENELRGPATIYFVVLAIPYSGLDDTDFYCYVHDGNSWVLFTTSYLRHTNRPGFVRISYKLRGDFLDVYCNKEMYLTLNPHVLFNNGHAK